MPLRHIWLQHALGLNSSKTKIAHHIQRLLKINNLCLFQTPQRSEGNEMIYSKVLKEKSCHSGILYPTKLFLKMQEKVGNLNKPISIKYIELITLQNRKHQAHMSSLVNSTKHHLTNYTHSLQFLSHDKNKRNTS